MEKIAVGVHEFPPLVQKDKDSWKGFEIDMWEYIAKDLNIQFEYKEEKNFQELLDKTSKGEYQISMAGISRMIERKDKLDLSFLTIESGLMIISRKVTNLSFRSLFKNVFNANLGIIVLALLLVAFFSANIFWLLERGQSVPLKYIPGFFESFWWAIVTFSTVGYGDIFPIGIYGRIFSVGAIMLGLAIFGLYIGNLSAALTIDRFKSEIDDAEDLKHITVGTKSNTTSEFYLNDHGIKNKGYSTMRDAYTGLLNNEVDAVVFDGPVLRNDIRGLKKKAILSRDVFARQTYAYIAPKGSDELINDINREIIKLHESEEYDILYKKYFE